MKSKLNHKEKTMLIKPANKKYTGLSFKRKTTKAREEKESKNNIKETYKNQLIERSCELTINKFKGLENRIKMPENSKDVISRETKEVEKISYLENSLLL
tara:strand:+ start:853 stop:1152 length:300 start_codon:yes stop_codon:yes gene_type:complete